MRRDHHFQSEIHLIFESTRIVGLDPYYNLMNQ